MISWAPEFPAGLLLSMRQTGCTELLLLDTELTEKNQYCQHFIEYFSEEFKFYRKLASPDPEISLKGFVKFIQATFPLEQFEQVYFNLAGGTKLHNIALWHLFLELGRLQEDGDKFEVVFANLQKFEFQEWQLVDGDLYEATMKIKVRITLKEYLNLQGFDFKLTDKSGIIYPEGSKLKINWKRDGAGSIFEKEIHNYLFDLFKRSDSLKKDIIAYTGIEIFEMTNKQNQAEYDLLIFSERIKFFIGEFKNRVKYSEGVSEKKMIESQKALTRKWGGAFCTFIFVKYEPMNNSLEENKILENIKKRELYKGLGIKYLTHPFSFDPIDDFSKNIKPMLEKFIG